LTDLNQALLNVLVHPPPDGVRPADLAEQRYMTKQAMNYLLGQLETLGYIERRAQKGRGRRLVFLTRRGWRVFESQWATAHQLEAEWAAVGGQKRFDEFMRTLRELVALQSKPTVRHGHEGRAIVVATAKRRGRKAARSAGA
jgi:DNA-binding MarR family transcriptional regulator